MKPVAKYTLPLAVLLIGLPAVLVGTLRPAAPVDTEPALVAQRIQQRLFEAQQDLATDPAAAQAGVEEAVAQHAAALAPQIPPAAAAAAQAAANALAQAQAAVIARDAPGLAAARADYKTALIWAGYLATIGATRSGSASSAGIWLKLRDYPPGSRFNPASSRATLAIQGLARGALTPAAATAAVKHELDAAYEALLQEALGATLSAAGQRFIQRAAESAALAAGYFRILQADFAARAGAERAGAAGRAFAALRDAAAAGDWPGVQRALAAVHAAFGA
jgi:hypothetical protein